MRWGHAHRGEIGPLITAARQRANLTQLEVASQIGVSRPQLANIETGRSDLPVSRLLRIAAALKISARDLLPP